MEPQNYISNDKYMEIGRDYYLADKGFFTCVSFYNTIKEWALIEVNNRSIEFIKKGSVEEKYTYKVKNYNKVQFQNKH